MTTVMGIDAVRNNVRPVEVEATVSRRRKPLSDRLCSNSRLTYDEVDAAGPAAPPLEFPAPTVHRCLRISVNDMDERTGKISRINNVIVRESDVIGIPRVHSQGYRFLKKLCNTTYGSVRLCNIVKRRHIFHEGGPAHRQSSDPDSLGRISEEGEYLCDDVDRISVEKNIIWEPTGEYAVVKIMSWEKIHHHRGRCLKDPVKEVAALELVGNSNRYVIDSVEVLQDNENLYSIMPYCNGGDLYSHIMDEIASNGKGRIEEAYARRRFRDILKGLDHLQKKGISHRDLSLDNILIHNGRCVIVDLGMALRVPYSDPCEEGWTTDASAGTTRRLMQAQGQGGRWTYMAPEVVARDDKFDGFSIDTFAAAVILFIMLVGRAPFQWATATDVHFKSFASGRLKETLRHWGVPISSEACDLLQGMMWGDPRKRLTLAQMTKHPWVVGQSDASSPRLSELEKEIQHITKRARPQDDCSSTPESLSTSLTPGKWIVGKVRGIRHAALGALVE